LEREVTTKHRIKFLFAACSWILLAGAAAFAAQRYEVNVEREVAVKMRDGIMLNADIYRPKADGKSPVLLRRTPYDKRALAPGFDLDFAHRAAARGYVVIIQDVRGRHTSQGEWYPFKYESLDGYDTVEWAAALPYSSGKVGMFGGSYDGATQMLTAIAAPPHLAGIFPFVTGSNYHDGWTYQGGAFELWFNEMWSSGLAQDTLSRRVGKDSNSMRWALKLPLADYPYLDLGTSDGLAPYFLDWLAHPAYDDYWKQWSIEERYAKILVPAYHVGGWYDIFLGGTLRNYMGVKAHAGNDEARRGQRLLVIVGGHAGSGPKLGELDFGPAAKLDLEEIMLRWYDHLLRGVENEIEKEKPVKIFVMGKNLYQEEDDWPPNRARVSRFYLHSAGNANSLRGDGTLSELAPQSEKADHLLYDPANPVPTMGGILCCDSAHLMSGPHDQRPVESRVDVLVYSTPEFKEDCEVTGPVSAEIYASSSAVDTEFTSKLVDVWPSGFAQNLAEGILRARFRNSQEKAEFMNPGEIYKLNIDLWGTSNVFLRGHRLRLEISSSNFPRFDRNLNSGEDPAHATRWVKATNTIYHDSEHPSALILPLVPQSGRGGPSRASRPERRVIGFPDQIKRVEPQETIRRGRISEHVKHASEFPAAGGCKHGLGAGRCASFGSVNSLQPCRSWVCET
jgi:putative CocE/NonD family hydrolase